MQASDKLPIFHGFASIENCKGSVVVTYAGNMGATIDKNVKPCVDAVLGKGSFRQLEKAGKSSGSPDYLFQLEIPLDTFNAIIR